MRLLQLVLFWALMTPSMIFVFVGLTLGGLALWVMGDDLP